MEIWRARSWASIPAFPGQKEHGRKGEHLSSETWMVHKASSWVFITGMHHSWTCLTLSHSHGDQQKATDVSSRVLFSQKRHCAASAQALYFGELASHTTVFRGDSNCHRMIHWVTLAEVRAFLAWMPGSHSLLRVAASYETMSVVILNCSRKTTPCWFSSALSHHRK